jgi:hypothetical protein
VLLGSHGDGRDDMRDGQVGEGSNPARRLAILGRGGVALGSIYGVIPAETLICLGTASIRVTDRLFLPP